MAVIGYRIHVDGQPRTFHDLKETAYAMARFLAGQKGTSRVRVICEASGEETDVSATGLATIVVPGILK
jgi:hypothetical protein